MRNATKLISVVILLVLLSVSAAAQDKDNLRKRIIDSVTKNERQWTLDESEALDGRAKVDIDVVSVRFLSDTAHVDVLILLYGSLDEAKKDYPTAFQSCPDCFVANCPDCSLEKKPLTTRIQNLGDENRMWEDRHKPLTGIVFRSGRVLVLAEAPSVELATRLALYVAREIDRGADEPTRALPKPLRAATRLR